MLSVSCPSSSEETNRGPNIRTPSFAEKSESLRFIFATQESEVGKVTREKRGRLEMIHFLSLADMVAVVVVCLGPCVGVVQWLVVTD